MITKTLEENPQDKDECVPLKFSVTRPLKKHDTRMVVWNLAEICLDSRNTIWNRSHTCASQLNEIVTCRLLSHIGEVEQKLYDSKREINALAEELAIMVSAFKENQLQIKAQQKTSRGVNVNSSSVICVLLFALRVFGIAGLVQRHFCEATAGLNPLLKFQRSKLLWSEGTKCVSNMRNGE